VFLPAVEVFRSQRDLGLSFADAAIVAVARRSAGGRVATFHRAFRKVAGFSVQPEELPAG